MKRITGYLLKKQTVKAHTLFVTGFRSIMYLVEFLIMEYGLVKMHIIRNGKNYNTRTIHNGLKAIFCKFRGINFKSVGGYPFALFVYNQRVTLYDKINLCFREKKFVKYLFV